jgi:hypothetical protein
VTQTTRPDVYDSVRHPNLREAAMLKAPKPAEIDCAGKFYDLQIRGGGESEIAKCLHGFRDRNRLNK